MKIAAPDRPQWHSNLSSPLDLVMDTSTIVQLIRQNLSSQQLRDIFDKDCSKFFFVPDGHQTQIIVYPYYAGDHKYRIVVKSKKKSLEIVLLVPKSQFYGYHETELSDPQQSSPV